MFLLLEKYMIILLAKDTEITLEYIDMFHLLCVLRDINLIKGKINIFVRVGVEYYIENEL